ncbi:hypothetical protein [Candidatus Phyllobacterium onerii]|uniref:hypothetical protein n=1 Tax=Candidatus Phyllobacterium onerii TaxID=3020828 RepID=UPI00232F8904|nr:hypothetical protein [Phyllobacterium sp. IY22]
MNMTLKLIAASIKQLHHVHPEYATFASNVEAAMRKNFEEWGHAPSEKHWIGLRAIIQIIEAMALGVAIPKYYLSGLPTGIGKTTTLIECTKELIRIGETTGNPVGILILTNTLDQIPVLIEAMGLQDYQYAVRTGAKNTDLNSRGVGLDTLEDDARHMRAQVLFTTQQKLHAVASKTDIPSFKNMPNFKFQRQPRAVRVWDEAIIPALPHVVTAYDIDHLKKPLLRKGFKEQADALDALVTEMKTLGDGIIDVPCLQLPNPEKYPDLYGSDDAIKTVESLVHMEDGRANLRHDVYSGATVLHYEEILPPHFEPLLVLDASADIRVVYDAWEIGRKNLVRLPAAKKTYKNLTIYHWDHGAGKTFHNVNSKRLTLADGIADLIAYADPDEPILLIIRKHGSVSKDRKNTQRMEVTIKDAVARRMAGGGRSGPPLHFLTWGYHLATNKYKDIKHVIVVGMLEYSGAQAEAMARGSYGMSVTKEFTETDLSKFHKGEIAHNLFQGVGRGMVRKSTIDGDVPEGCTLHIIYPLKAGKRSVGHEILLKIFPGAKILDWVPASDMTLKPTEVKLVNELARLANSSPEGGRATWKQLGAVVGLVAKKNSNVFERLREPRVIAEMAKRGICIEHRQGDRRGNRVYRCANPRMSDASRDAIAIAQAKRAGQRQKRQERHALKKAA